ncbi:MAG: hypothetical protein ACOYXN_02890 [Acidobacteriota bacterium]
MKSGAKIALGVLGILLAVCVLSAVGFFLSDTGKKVMGFSGKVMKIAGTGKGLERLEKAHPFTPPESGVVEEARLEAYLRVCEAVKPEADAYSEWLKAHEGVQGQKGDFETAQQAVEGAQKVLGAYVAALERESMGPGEFRFIQRAMEEAEESLPKGSGSDLERALLRDLEEAAGLPGLSEADRAALNGKAARYRAALGMGEGGLTGNAALYARYRDRLEASMPSGEAGAILGGHGGHRRSGPVIRVD